MKSNKDKYLKSIIRSKSNRDFNDLLSYPLHLIIALQSMLMGIFYILYPRELNMSIDLFLFHSKTQDDLIVYSLMILGILQIISILSHWSKVRTMTTIIMGGLIFVQFIAHLKFNIDIHPSISLIYIFTQFMTIILASIVEEGD